MKETKNIIAYEAVKKRLKKVKFKFDCAKCSHALYNGSIERYQCLMSLTDRRTVYKGDDFFDVLECEQYKKA